MSKIKAVQMSWHKNFGYNYITIFFSAHLDNFYFLQPMLLIELISISNMGVSLIETCFCSRLYGIHFIEKKIFLNMNSVSFFLLGRWSICSQGYSRWHFNCSAFRTKISELQSHDKGITTGWPPIQAIGLFLWWSFIWYS